MIVASITYTMAGTSNFPLSLATTYLKVKSEQEHNERNITYCFEHGRPDKMLLNIEYNDMDMDLGLYGSVGTKNRVKNSARDMANNFVTRGIVKPH